MHWAIRSPISEAWGESPCGSPVISLCFGKIAEVFEPIDGQAVIVWPQAECRPIYTTVFVSTGKLDIVDDVGIIGKVVFVHVPISDVRSKASISLFTPSSVS
jgi:hypothetical protein